MDRLVLFCKSYDKDMLRARRMAESVALYNADRLPLYMSVPAKDLRAFRECFGSIPCHFMTDEEVVAASARVNGPLPETFSMHLMQQLVKLEFWRTGVCENYLWLDSDGYFIREFREADFFADDGTLLTVMNDGREFREYAVKHGKPQLIEDFERSSRNNQSMFDRDGECYDFGPCPVLWSCRVLESFYVDYLKLRGQTIFEVLEHYHPDNALYGEYLLYSKVIPINPIEPLFKVFHYSDQFSEAQAMGEWDYTYARQGYFGVIIQSNWARVETPKEGRWRKLAKLFRWGG